MTERNKDTTGEKIPQLRPSQLEALLKLAIPNKKKILLVGPPGVGKTSIPRQVASDLGYKVITDHPVYGDPTDGKGIPWINQAEMKADYFPAGNLAKVLSATEPTLWLIDDFGQASPSVQASYMPPLLDRTINGHKIPDYVSVMATTNARSHRAGVQGLLEPVKSRFDTIIGLSVNLDDSCQYFLNLPDGDQYLEDASVELVSFLRFKEAEHDSILHNFVPTADLTNSPCPRTWEAVMRWVALFLEHPQDPGLELDMISGAVGAPAAAMYIAFQKIKRSLPSLDLLIADPQRAPIPCNNSSAMYAICTGLATRATTDNFGRIYEYSQRLEKHRCNEKHRSTGMMEFAVLLMRDCWRKDRALLATKAGMDMMSGPIGKMIHG